MPSNFTPRRSFRIALADRGLNSELKAKQVLLRRLGLLAEGATMTEELLSKYAMLFERPLAEDVMHAFADFFGWTVPTSFDAPDSVCCTSPRLVEPFVPRSVTCAPTFYGSREAYLLECVWPQ